MKTAAVVSGFERFKGSTMVAQGYFEALQRLGYEPHWYQCVTEKNRREYWTPERVVCGVSTGVRSFDQGLNFSLFFPRRLGRLTEELVLITDPALLGVVDANPGAFVIVHDLREFSREGRTGLVAGVLFFYLMSKIRRARGILVDSESTRVDLAHRIRSLPPTAVLHPAVPFTANGTDHLRRCVERRRAHEPLRFLYVAVDRPYKQLRFLIDLARALDARGLDAGVHLVLISQLRSSTQQYLDRDPPRSLTVVPAVEEISREYDASDALLFPSRFEGFGLPIVEAMSFGLPIIGGTMPAVAELLNGAGIQLGRYDVGTWIGAMAELQDPSTYEAWASRSLARAEYFSPANFQQRLAKVLQEWL